VVLGADNAPFGAHPGHVTVPAGTIQFPPLAEQSGDTDVLHVNLVTGGKMLEAVVGLGTDPLTAEEIISSLRRA
jgi:hypothetical protein